jgi:regulator of protease activity HflC (stomatin/prohibitin superfamily)
MIRDCTGLNEARDGSMPEKDTLIGLQKMAVNASNTATRHVMQASLWLTVRTCENISLKVADSLKNPLTLNSLKSSISTYNVGTLAEIQNLPLHDFGIYLELEPEEEEKAMLEQNIQMSLQQGGIDLEDAIDIRRIKNLKLANDVLKQKRKQKQKMAQEQQKQVAQAQEMAKAQAAQATAEVEMQKQQALTAANVQYEQAKNQMEIQKIQTQAQIKREEMEIKHMYDLELKRMEVEAMTTKENMIEDRKDKRTKMEGTQQSKMIEQRKMNLMPTDFEQSTPEV